MTRDEYQALKDKAYVLSDERFEKMEDNGWCYISLNPIYSDEAIEENIGKLSKYNKVKIYKGTTRIRGVYRYYGMGKY